MKYHKTLKLAVHHEITKLKLNKLEKLTARITYCIRIFSDLLDVFHFLDFGFFALPKPEMIKMLRPYSNAAAEATGLSSAYVQQCIDKALESWLSYVRLHNVWEGRVEYYNRNKESFGKRYGYRLMKKEPGKPFRQHNKKVSCRLDKRTCPRIIDDGNYIIYWANISSLTKNKPLLVPLNPSSYHLNLMKNGRFKTSEIKKKGRKYYLHLTYEYEVEDKPCSLSKTSYYRGIDLGICRAAATVLLHPGEKPKHQHVSLFLQNEMKQKLNSVQQKIKKAQQENNCRLLKALRNKRRNISEYYDRVLAKSIAKPDKEILDLCVCLGNLKHIRNMQYKGSGNRRLRKMINLFSFQRRSAYLQNKYNEIGTKLFVVSEYKSSKRCSYCNSDDTKRISQSKLICYTCSKTYDADINASRNIAATKIGTNKSFVTYRAGTESTVHQDEPAQSDDFLQSRDEAQSKRAVRAGLTPRALARM
ncbi:MAG: transposase [Candidatus Woesearchaeota archaeon]